MVRGAARACGCGLTLRSSVFLRSSRLTTSRAITLRLRPLSRACRRISVKASSVFTSPGVGDDPRGLVQDDAAAEHLLELGVDDRVLSSGLRAGDGDAGYVRPGVRNGQVVVVGRACAFAEQVRHCPGPPRAREHPAHACMRRAVGHAPPAAGRLAHDSGQSVDDHAGALLTAARAVRGLGAAMIAPTPLYGSRLAAPRSAVPRARSDRPG